MMMTMMMTMMMILMMMMMMMMVVVVTLMMIKVPIALQLPKSIPCLTCSCSCKYQRRVHSTVGHFRQVSYWAGGIWTNARRCVLKNTGIHRVKMK